MNNKQYEIFPNDWQIFATKLLSLCPGRTLGDKHKWLAEKTGISVSTTQNWVRKNANGEGEKPSMPNLEKIAGLIDTPLYQLIVMVQQQLDPPAPPSELVNGASILAISAIDRSEIELTAKSLSGVTQAEIFAAASNLMLIAQAL